MKRQKLFAFAYRDYVSEILVLLGDSSSSNNRQFYIVTLARDAVYRVILQLPYFIDLKIRVARMKQWTAAKKISCSAKNQ